MWRRAYDDVFCDVTMTDVTNHDNEREHDVACGVVVYATIGSQRANILQAR